MSSALAIAAHPDDIEFVMAGTLVLLREAGWTIHYFNLSTGNLGSSVMSAAHRRCITARYFYVHPMTRGGPMKQGMIGAVTALAAVVTYGVVTGAQAPAQGQPPAYPPPAAKIQQGDAPGYAFDITKAEIDYVLKNSPASPPDRQLRVVDMGKYNVSVGVLRRAGPRGQGRVRTCHPALRRSRHGHAKQQQRLKGCDQPARGSGWPSRH